MCETLTENGMFARLLGHTHDIDALGPKTCIAQYSMQKLLDFKVSHLSSAAGTLSDE